MTTHQGQPADVTDNIPVPRHVGRAELESALEFTEAEARKALVAADAWRGHWKAAVKAGNAIRVLLEMEPEHPSEPEVPSPGDGEAAAKAAKES